VTREVHDPGTPEDAPRINNEDQVLAQLQFGVPEYSVGFRPAVGLGQSGYRWLEDLYVERL
jgi:hypothetical protein